MWKLGFFVALLLIAVVSAKPKLGRVRDLSAPTRRGLKLDLETPKSLMRQRGSTPKYETLKSTKRGYKYDVENPESLMWERGLIPQYEDDPDVYRDTAWFLDKIIMDEAEVVHQPIPPELNYRFGSGKKQECINGKKTLPPQCQWKGMVILQEEPTELVEVKLTVSNKYCNRAGDKPKPKVIECEE